MELTVSSIIEEKMNEYWADENKVKQNFQDEKKRIGGRGRGGGTYRNAIKEEGGEKNKETGGSENHRPGKMVETFRTSRFF